MNFIPTRTQNGTAAAGEHLRIDDGHVETRLLVIYAASEAVDIGGAPLQEIPLELIEDDAGGNALARALVAAAEIYTAADGWLIEYRDADGVPADDMRRLAARLGEVWDEYVGVDCQTCGDAGFVEAGECFEGAHVTLRGDCPDCGAA